MVFEFIAGSMFGAWSSKRKAKREITNMADRLRRGSFIHLPGETDEEYVERARVWDREQQRAAEQHARDHPEQWDPEVYEAHQTDLQVSAHEMTVVGTFSP